MSKAHLTHCTGWLQPARIAVASAVAVTVVGVGAAAGASILDADGTIRGCVTNRPGLLGGLLGPGQGSLRVIDPATGRCDGGETPIQWNQAGRPGPPGPTGPPGPPGPAGPPGSVGPSGLGSLRVAEGRVGIRSDATETFHVVAARCQSGETALSASFSNEVDNASLRTTVLPVELRRDPDGRGYLLVVTDLFRLVYPNAPPPAATTVSLEVLCAR